ncbi:MAG: HNH endonuclease [Boseongicola sp. SB0662_bin_57]|nr:HNH endonuclease [Boseongicola sp. SB0662_bin_57]
MAKIGSKERIRRFLKPRVGEVVTAKQIQEAVGPHVTEWARRLRELRQEGWPISSHNDRADLKPGQYVLEALPEHRLYRFAPNLSGRIRAQVLERNGYTCQMCGIGAGETTDNGRKARLHVGHIVDRDHGGSDELSNLRALCSVCNQGAKNIVQEPPSWTWLMSQVRRASVDDQRAVMDWLKRKFGETGNEH